MKTTLVIMAAGICSRFGGGIKQLAPVGLNGEIIMDYSIHDAIEAGLEEGFKEFFANMGNKDILKAEYLLPIYIDELLQAGKVSVKVLDTNDKWFGVTYKEDKDYVVKSFAKLIEAGVYQKDLFEDLK